MDILECSSRFISGRSITEEEFDLECVYPKMKEVIQKYEIRFDPENPVPDDDALADRVFEAAVELLSEVGIYCTDIQKNARFDREEIVSALKGSRPECRFGEGDSAKVWKPRRPDDSDTPPWCNVGTGIVATTEEMMMKRVAGSAAVERADSLTIPALNQYKGYNISPNHPSEILGSIHDMKLAREAMQKEGRPGLAIFNVVPTSGTVQATIATSNAAFGTRPSDGWYVAVYPEFKTTLDMLSKVAFLKEIGANYASECSSILGGHVGGVEGVAVASAAYSFFNTTIYDATYHLNFPVHFHKAISTTRKMLWAISVSSQAVSRNTSIPWFNTALAANGPATENYFYEAAAYILSSITSGVSAGTPYPNEGVRQDGSTPLESLFHAEMTNAGSKMTRSEANEVVKRLLNKYEESLANPDMGLTYPECFDMNENKPNEDYARLYDKVKKVLFSIGVKF